MQYLFIRLHKLCLYSRQCHYTNNIFPRASTGQIIDRLCDTLQHWTVSFCLPKTLYQLVTDIAAVEIREYQYIGFTR